MRSRGRRGAGGACAAPALALAFTAAAAGLLAPAAARADSTSVALPAWLAQVSLNGFLSSSYSYNFNRPDSGMNTYRVFDFDDNTFKLDVFELVLQKPAAKPRESGFRVDLTMGSSIPRVTAASGLFRDASGTAQDFDLQQAFASWVAPVGSGLRLDLGKFVTHLGYEVIDGYDGWNDNATRSLLFGYAIPFTHTGVHATYAFSPKVAVIGMVVNGWDVARDNNRSKSVGGQLALTPVTPLSVYFSGMWGPERNGDNFHDRTVLDAVAVLKDAHGRSLGINGDWASEDWRPGEGALTTPGFRPTHHWMGIAGYARAPLTSSLALIARAEYFDDRDGDRTGTAQDLSEWTVTPELKLTPRMILRADVRSDRSNRSVFQKDSRRVDSQTTVLVNALYAF